MRFPKSMLFLAALSLTAGAAEPPVNPSDLPRPKPLEPGEALRSLAVRPGYRVELMAAEPMVEGPVAMAFDEAGKLYVVEMRDYPESREEKLGQVKLLEDTDGDGRFDKASVFADNLPWPTGIVCWDGGVFVLASPDLLYFKDTDGDRKADVHAMVFTGFGNKATRLNVQALPNSLQWGPDQRIHGALGGNPGLVQNFAWFGQPRIDFQGKDFSFDPTKMDLRPESGGGQFGMTFDDTGRKYVCSNSRHLVQVIYEARVAERVTDYPLPAPAVDIAADGPQAEVFRRSPDEAWRVIRTQWRVSGAVKGMIEGGGRASGYFTSASGVTVYKGDAIPEFQGDVFIADCGSNLVHHKRLTGDLLREGKRAPGEEKAEFIASTDNWFRPVAFANAPDGTLWFADMYREVIEHPWSLPDSLKQHLDLTSGRNRGRLYRIVPDNAKKAAPRPAMEGVAASALVAILEHPNGWHRETAARLLHQRQDSSVAPELMTLARESASVSARILALHVLQGLSMLGDGTLSVALKDGDADVRANAVRLCAITGLAREQLASLAADPSSRVRAEVAWALVGDKSPVRIELLSKLLEGDEQPWIRHAALAAAGSNVEPFWRS